MVTFKTVGPGHKTYDSGGHQITHIDIKKQPRGWFVSVNWAELPTCHKNYKSAEQEALAELKERGIE